MAEIMNDLAILMHLGSLTGLPVYYYQFVSDVKDFFNQHYLCPAERWKVGFVTLEPDAILRASGGVLDAEIQRVEGFVARLRAEQPGLVSVAEDVLGFGLYPASNICQRHAHLLILPTNTLSCDTWRSA